MPILNNDDMEKVLDIVFTGLQKEGMIPEVSADEKKQIIDGVMAQLQSNEIEIDGNDLRNPAMQKTLAVAVVSQFVQGRNPNFKFDCAKLFQPIFDPQDLHQELKPQLENLLKELNKLNPANPMPDEKIKALANHLVDQFAQKQEMDQPLAKNETFIDTIAALFTECLRNTSKDTAKEQYTRDLNGGVDPQVAGGVVQPVVRFVENLLGAVDLGPDLNQFTPINANRTINPQAGLTDATMGIIENKISSGSLIDSLEQSLMDEGLIPTAPQLKPPSTHQG